MKKRVAVYISLLASLINADATAQHKTMQSEISNREVTLSPQIREQTHRPPAAPLPQNIMQQFLSHNMVATEAELDAAPYVLGGQEGRLLVALGDDFYARGDFIRSHITYGIYRPGQSYLDPATGELFGVHAKQVGSARIKQINGSIATLTATGSSAELRRQDRLFLRQDHGRVTAVSPRSLDNVIEGQVLAVPEGLRKAGFLDIVALNRGTRHGLSNGATMVVYQAGNSINDPITDQRMRLPDERIGLLTVFYTYEKMSFGLVMAADRPLTVGDRVSNP
jgi:hypothetical protein